jgi:hypothetical protein
VTTEILIGVSWTVELRLEAVTTTSSSWLGLSVSAAEKADSSHARNIAVQLNKIAGLFGWVCFVMFIPRINLKKPVIPSAP